MLGTPTPRRVARYQNARGQVYDMHYFEGDFEQFIDERSVLWRRIALTEREYTSVALASSELEALCAPMGLL